jgi:ferredoxin--NADP+ reductase
LVSPIEILDDGAGNVSAVRVERNELRATADGYLNAHGTGEMSIIPAGMILRSVGYKGIALADVPYEERSGTINNREGRVIDRASGTPVSGEYVVGWAKRGPTGIIGTNKADAAETVERIVADLPTLTPAPEADVDAIERLLQGRGVKYVTIEGWRILDQIETMRGSDSGRPRIKITTIAEMLAAIEEATGLNVPS